MTLLHRRPLTRQRLVFTVRSRRRQHRGRNPSPALGRSSQLSIPICRHREEWPGLGLRVSDRRALDVRAGGGGPPRPGPCAPQAATRPTAARQRAPRPVVPDLTDEGRRAVQSRAQPKNDPPSSSRPGRPSLLEAGRRSRAPLANASSAAASLSKQAAPQLEAAGPAASRWRHRAAFRPRHPHGPRRGPPTPLSRTTPNPVTAPGAKCQAP